MEVRRIGYQHLETKNMISVHIGRYKTMSPSETIHFSDETILGVNQLQNPGFTFGDSVSNIFPENGYMPDAQSIIMFMIILEQTLHPEEDFVIFTTSEYMVRMAQLSVANGTISPEMITIQDSDRTITINSDGSLSMAFYPGFVDEASRLALDLLHHNAAK